MSLIKQVLQLKQRGESNCGIARQLPINKETVNGYMQIIDDRYNRKALILASQPPVADWYNVFQSELIAEACLDRIVHKSKKFELKGESLRKKY